MASSTDHYKTLGIRSDATLDEIKAAFRRLVLVHHPDKVPTSEVAAATARTQDINDAYSILKDPETRRKYDRTIPGGGLARSKHAQSQPNRETRRSSDWESYGHDDEWFRRTSEQADARARRRRDDAEERERNIREQAQQRERRRRWREADREKCPGDTQRAAEALRENISRFIPRESRAAADDMDWQRPSDHDPSGAVGDDMDWEPTGERNPESDVEIS